MDEQQDNRPWMRVGRELIARVTKAGRTDILEKVIVDVTVARLRVARAFEDAEYELALLYGDGSLQPTMGVLNATSIERQGHDTR